MAGTVQQPYTLTYYHIMKLQLQYCIVLAEATSVGSV
jgi:hypothetical protein